MGKFEIHFLLLLLPTLLKFYIEVINDGIQRRKDTPGDPPPDDYAWRKEDALLDLLQLFGKHDGLFALPEDTSEIID